MTPKKSTPFLGFFQTPKKHTVTVHFLGIFRKSADNWELAIPYFKMAKLSPSEILQQACKTNEKGKQVRNVRKLTFETGQLAYLIQANSSHQSVLSTFYRLPFQLKLLDYGKGLFHYFNHMLFESEQTLDVTQVSLLDFVELTSPISCPKRRTHFLTPSEGEGGMSVKSQWWCPGADPGFWTGGSGVLTPGRP